MAITQMVEEMLYTNPLLLLAIEDEQVIQEINELVPYSTAFEIECDYRSDYNVDNFNKIPDIMSVNNDPGEQRYRIPNGLKGIICLYGICNQLKLNSLLNPLSGIHYHVDCTDYFRRICDIINSDRNHIEYILSELDTWLEGDVADNRNIGSWFKLNDLQTIEFRLGEMTFDYARILKRIIHCNAIVRKFKLIVNPALVSTFTSVDVEKVIKYNSDCISEWKSNRKKKLEGQLNRLTKKAPEVSPPPPQDSLEVMRQVIKNRLHNI